MHESSKQHQEHGLVQTNNRQIRENSIEQDLDFIQQTEENVRRQQTISEFCIKADETQQMPDLRETNNAIRTLTDPNYSFIYCRVNKAASTFTINLLERLFNCSVDCMRNAAERLYTLPPGEIREITDRAYKFMFVREPYGRLFSTYSNKFYFPKGNWSPIGPKIVKRYRQNPSEDSLRYGHDVTFAELIRYVVDEFEDGNEATIDEHVRPVHIRCNPCDYKYNFIGKLETLKSDWGYVLHEWESRNLVKTGEQVKSTTTFHMERIRFTLAKLKESNIPLYNIYERAWRYLQITGDISKHIQMPFPKFVNSDIYKIKLVPFLQAREIAANLTKINATEVKSQRREAMLQAYSTVPLEYLERLRKAVMKDCLLYGYDDRPEWLFDRKTDIEDRKSFQYFTGLD